jgi:hypothetical protein
LAGVGDGAAFGAADGGDDARGSPPGAGRGGARLLDHGADDGRRRGVRVHDDGTTGHLGPLNDVVDDGPHSDVDAREHVDDHHHHHAGLDLDDDPEYDHNDHGADVVAA